MSTYVSKPVTVEAVKYTAPDGAEIEGNVDEIDAFAEAVVQQQAPWNPADGQSCLLIIVEDHDPQLLKPNDYLVASSAGPLAVDGDKFEAAYALKTPEAKPTDQK